MDFRGAISTKSKHIDSGIWRAARNEFYSDKIITVKEKINSMVETKAQLGLFTLNSLESVFYSDNLFSHSPNYEFSYLKCQQKINIKWKPKFYLMRKKKRGNKYEKLM